MSDTYQAIYDAVRSRISNGDIGSAIERVAYERIDFSHAVACLQGDVSAAVAIVAENMTRPSAIYRPSIYEDGDQWCALYGTDIAIGVCGFGDTPELACAEFDKAWKEKTQSAKRQEAIYNSQFGVGA